MTRQEIIEKAAADAHDAWIATKRSQGITSRPSADGVEQMVPYDQLPEDLKDLDRATVASTVDFLIGEQLLKVDG